MGDIEDGLRRLAEHRAAEVPAVDAGLALPATASVPPRRGWLVPALAAGLAVVLGVGGWLVWGRGDDTGRLRVSTSLTPTSAVSPSTAVPTTAPAGCLAPALSTATEQGPGSLANPPNSAVLTNVTVAQLDSCHDRITFSFDGGTPAWTVGYQSGPFTHDASGAPVSVAGSAFLVIRFEHAAGSDPAKFQVSPAYPTDLQPAAPSQVRELVRIGDFEGVVRWVAGLDGERGFRVAEAPGSVTIDVQRPPA